MLTTIRYLLLTALRDWLFFALPLGVLAIMALSLFLSSTSLVEEREMSLVLSAGLSRIYIMIGLILFICFHVRRSFENREIEMFLSKPMSRASFVLCYWIGFSVIAALFVIFLFVVLLLFIPTNYSGFIGFAASMFAEAMIVTAFALAASLIMQSAVSAVLASFCFYFIGRMMGYMLAFLDRPGTFNPSLNHWDDFVMAGTSMLLPRLDLFGKTEWLLRGFELSGLWPFLVQSAVYIPLLLLMGMYDFTRRQF
jgi:hypothetical protein